MIAHFSNVHLFSNLRESIKFSISDLMDDLEEYYSVLPLPTISKELLQQLSPETLNLRAKNREKLFLEPDEV